MTGTAQAGEGGIAALTIGRRTIAVGRTYARRPSRGSATSHAARLRHVVALVPIEDGRVRVFFTTGEDRPEQHCWARYFAAWMQGDGQEQLL